jgi:hypothetical protein
MKPAEAPTLSQHLLHETARFFVYPHKVSRSKSTMIAPSNLYAPPERFDGRLL